MTKFTLILSKGNLEEGVSEVKAVEMFWNGFACTFPIDTKYWFIILAIKRFSVPFPIFKEWRNSRLFSTRDYLFYCGHISQESPFASSIIWQKYLDLRFCFLHDWYNCVIFCMFPSGRYYWWSVLSWGDSLYLVSFQQVLMLPMEFYFP